MVEPIEAQTQLYGKSVSELQSDITINKDGTISGTLNYIKDYKQFSDVEEEQSGNYLALKFKEATEGKNVKVKLTKEVTLDDSIPTINYEN